ncbi:hypothetical protein V1477_002370, partial [Vespula maculifrons]
MELDKRFWFGSFCIQAAHAPVVTADTSYVNPFLHTKLWKSKKEWTTWVPRGTSQSALPIDRRCLLLLLLLSPPSPPYSPPPLSPPSPPPPPLSPLTSWSPSYQI